MDMSVEGEEMEVSMSVPMPETLLNEQDRSQVVLKAMFNGDKTYDNQTGKIQQNGRTTYKKENHRVTGTSKLLEWSPRGSCNYGSCPHWGEGDRNATKVQGHIHSASKSGLRPRTHRGTVEQSRSISRQ